MTQALYSHTIQMPVTFYTESDVTYYDPSGDRLDIDILYVMYLDIGIPYICRVDRTTGKKSIYNPPKFSEIFPMISGRRYSKLRPLTKHLPEAIGDQYILSENLNIIHSVKKDKKLIEGGVVMRELLRKLALFSNVKGI